jgi:hypothetical protein
MNLPKLLSLLDAGERGQYADLQWFYHYMEWSDAMVCSVIPQQAPILPGIGPTGPSQASSFPLVTAIPR